MNKSLSPHLKERLITMYVLATSDGTLDEKELAYMLDIAAKNGISQDAFLEMVQGKDAISHYIPESLEEKVQSLYELTAVLWADGVVHPEERKILISYARKYGFQEENLEDIATFLIEEVRKGGSVADIIAQMK